MEEVKINDAMETKIKDLIPIEDAVKLFESVQKPPEDALKPIDAGRLKGKNEISPLWRMKAMTEKFGLYGDGWKFEVTKEWKEPIEVTKEVIVQVSINLFTRNRNTGEWNAPSPATGSAYLIVKDKNGLHGNENAWASAFTDAFGKACKPFGIGYDVYLGKTNNNNRGNGQPNNGYNNYNRNNYQNNYNNRPQGQNNQQSAAQNRPNTNPNPQQAQNGNPANKEQMEAEKLRKERLAQIVQTAKELKIPNDDVKAIIKSTFNKNSTAELSLGELVALQNNLPSIWKKKTEANNTPSAPQEA